MGGIKSGKIRTAGTYLWTGSHFVFQVGPNKTGDRLGVVRLGGHLEPGETPWQAVRREVLEEATMAVTPLPVPATYLTSGGELQVIAWEERPAPLLVYQREPGAFTPLYLTYSADSPTPAAETRGLLLLDREWLARLVREEMSLDRYLAAGGRAILREELPGAMLLAPSYYLGLLDRLLGFMPLV